MMTPTCSPIDEARTILLGQKEGICRFDHGLQDVLMQLPLPGIVIFVHGVNSDGEWFEQAEKGLCAGLNARLARGDHQLTHHGAEAGQLSPAKYISELDDDGFINPDMNAKSFIQTEDTFSPVIRFRFGYKASGEELQEFGDSIYLNEENYWGGGPFANGCTTLPDLWGKGLSEELFLWTHVQHLNPTNDRKVFSCPPRPYYVLAAYRLAKLVESLRQKQADVPITIVCHSQGNMVGMAAAFLGDRLPDAVDPAGHRGRCVADTYVLCNPPYSLVKGNFAESWAERGMADAHGRTGRQTAESRAKTLAAFFDIIRQRAPLQQDAARIDQRMANVRHGFNAKQDRQDRGLNGSTYGRVTLYCNPHDQVISATTVQGIGWRGMDAKEIETTRGAGVFTQRVFAQGFKVGEEGVLTYDCWANHYKKPKPGSQDFWVPPSPAARYSLSKGLEANRNPLGLILTLLFAPIAMPILAVVNTRINALPPEKWVLPLHAPKLPVAFLPESFRFGKSSEAFDEGKDAPGESRNKERPRGPDDPYAGDHIAEDGHTDAAKGDKATEAALRYEHHADLRMQAKREHLYKNNETVVEEQRSAIPGAEYKAWRDKKIKSNLESNIDTHATDHSTIMTNAKHAEMALAYDVAIGNCDIRQEDLRRIRVAADWRFLKGLDDDDPHKIFLEYFALGKFKGASTHDWANAKGSEGSTPTKIADEREFPAPSIRENK